MQSPRTREYGQIFSAMLCSYPIALLSYFHLLCCGLFIHPSIQIAVPIIKRIALRPSAGWFCWTTTLFPTKFHIANDEWSGVDQRTAHIAYEQRNNAVFKCDVKFDLILNGHWLLSDEFEPYYISTPIHALQWQALLGSSRIHLSIIHRFVVIITFNSNLFLFPRTYAQIFTNAQEDWIDCEDSCRSRNEVSSGIIE